MNPMTTVAIITSVSERPLDLYVIVAAVDIEHSQSGMDIFALRRERILNQNALRW